MNRRPGVTMLEALERNRDACKTFGVTAATALLHGVKAHPWRFAALVGAVSWLGYLSGYDVR